MILFITLTVKWLKLLVGSIPCRNKHFYSLFFNFYSAEFKRLLRMSCFITSCYVVYCEAIWIDIQMIGINFKAIKKVLILSPRFCCCCCYYSTNVIFVFFLRCSLFAYGGKLTATTTTTMVMPSLPPLNVRNWHVNIWFRIEGWSIESNDEFKLIASV